MTSHYRLSNRRNTPLSRVRIGLLGLGQLGRHIFRLALEDPRYEVAAVSDRGRPEIVHRLLAATMTGTASLRLENNCLISQPAGAGKESSTRTWILPAVDPDHRPWWDVFGADLVIDATGLAVPLHHLMPHLENGAKRVIVSVLPEADVDRVVLFGINHDAIKAEDSIVSAGSASTTATALALKVLSRAGPIRHASITSVHSYTGDQSLNDHGGPDYRRSRSGAENIIPNETPASYWVQRVLPHLSGKLSGLALNVPVRSGSLLDLTVAFADSGIRIQDINDLFLAAASAKPEWIAATTDPIVSSDIRGCSQSILVDLNATMKAGSRLIKLLAWHESLGHARRILDLAAAYARKDTAEIKVHA